MNRKLCSIQRITSLEEIEGADFVVKATVLGWELVVLKDEFNVGELCVYCEVDTILPEKPEFKFLRSRKFRIRTIRLRGQVSQGIALPLSVLPKGKYAEGDDVTSILKAVKYDPQAEAEQKELDRQNQIHKNRLRKYFMRYSWFRRMVLRPQRLPRPSFVRKTDEDRIQLFPNICTEKAGVEFFATEKLDGTSASYFLVKKGLRYKYGVCSRNFEMTRKDNVYWEISEKYKIKDKLRAAIDKDDLILVQGEIIGPKVQGNKYKLDELKFYVFNLKMGRRWYYHPEVIEFYADLDAVPLVSENYFLPATISEAVKTACGKSVISDTPREGIVVRDGSGMSFKIFNPDFLIKYDD